ncbi:MAG: hypothetical protein Q7Q71_06080 [Verrucomicrobiota bacterium JB023]|nr:hypothetical protein [Verrucomicrobiota bacterium JB023]
MKFTTYGRSVAAIYLAATPLTQAQLTWDPDSDQINNGGAGFWGTQATDTNWDDDGSAPNILWINGSDAIFGDAGETYTVTIDNTGAFPITVGNITATPGEGNAVVLDGLITEDALTVNAGGATWDTGGEEIAFQNTNGNETLLSMTSGDTLTITGGGQFDTGFNNNVNPNVPWDVAGATLEATDPIHLRGDSSTIGQFDLIKLPAGSRFDHARNSPRTYGNDLELTGTGYVLYDPTWSNSNPKITFNGIVSGTAGLEISGLANDNWLKLNNAENSFTGGIIIDGEFGGELQATEDGQLGAVPASFDPDNLILRNMGILFYEGETIDSNRGITLENGGVMINSAKPRTYGGTITGTGPFQVGRDDGYQNTLTLTSDTHDYTGGTNIRKGRIILGIDEALPSDTIVTIGGQAGGQSKLVLASYTQTIGGVTAAGNNTRRIVNYDSGEPVGTGGAAGTLILDVADSEDETLIYEYLFNGATGYINTTDSGNFNLVKEGEGGQQLGNLTIAGTLTINSGILGAAGEVLGAITVNDGGTFNPGSASRFQRNVGGFATGSSLTLASGSTLAMDINSSTLESDFITMNGDLLIDGSATLDLSDVEAETVAPGTKFTLIDYFGYNLTGTFAGLPEGGTVTVGSTQYTISYADDSTVSLTAGGSVSNAYDAWVSANYPGLTGGFDGDPDGDGIASGLEWYFLNSDPTAATSASGQLMQVADNGDGSFTFTHLRPTDRAGVTETYQWSTDLDNFYDDGASDGTYTVDFSVPSSGETAGQPAGYEMVTITVTASPTDLGKLFARLELSN